MQKTTALKEHEDDLKRLRLVKKLALAKAEMEAAVKKEDGNHDFTTDNPNLPKQINKTYVLHNYLKTQALSVTSISNATVQTNVRSPNKQTQPRRTLR